MANRKRNISFAKPEEPLFIKKLKEKHGIIRGPDVDTKKEILQPSDDQDLEDKDEEQPVIVVLKDGDLTEEEVKQMTDENKSKEKQKIVFKKPEKTSEKRNDLIQSSIKTKDSFVKQKSDENIVKTVANSRLLSFTEEEDEEY